MTSARLALALLLLPTIAHAEGFANVLVGMQLPVGDSDWTNTVDVSAKLALRAGALQHGIGGMVSADWTPEHLTSKYSSPNGFDTGASAHRFRVLAHLVVEKQLAPKLALDARVGGGIDIAHASYDFTLLGVRAQDSRTDLGPAFELGGGVWWPVGTGSMQLGGELAFAYGHHDLPSKNGSVGFVYTSYDLDLLFGLRFRSD